MQTLEAIEQRRSVKHYTSHKMTEAEITKLMSHVILSPTSFNIQNWRFVIVTDTDLRKELRKAAWDQAQVEESSILIILTADLKSWSKQPERYWMNAPEAARGVLLPMIKQFYENKDQVQRDEAMRSCGIAAQSIMLAAKDMGYDSSPMIGFDPIEIAKLINLPSDHVIAMMISVGKADKPARERGGQLALEEVIIKDRFK